MEEHIAEQVATDPLWEIDESLAKFRSKLEETKNIFPK